MRHEAAFWETGSSIVDAGSKLFIGRWSKRLSRCERFIHLSRRWRSAQDLRSGKYRSATVPEVEENQNMEFANFCGGHYWILPASGGSANAAVRWRRRNEKGRIQELQEFRSCRMRIEGRHTCSCGTLGKQNTENRIQEFRQFGSGTESGT
jgi:hypothetical protein